MTKRKRLEIREVLECSARQISVNSNEVARCEVPKYTSKFIIVTLCGSSFLQNSKPLVIDLKPVIFL